MARAALVACALLLTSTAALASDGVIEINQAKALGGNVTPGDAPGFPVTLSQPGSYLLTGSLTVPANLGGIAVGQIQAGVQIDLGGFEIAGPGTCSGGSGPALTCTGAGASGFGIDAPVPVRVRNGRVRGFAQGGVRLQSSRNQIENLRVEDNAGDGIFAGKGSVVVQSVAARNFGHGLSVDGAVVDRCSAWLNRLTGMRNLSSSGSTFLGVVAQNNGAQGILAANNSVVRDSSVTFNTLDGIVAYAGSLVSDNVSSDNGQAGIAALSTSLVQRNSVLNNGGIGLYLFPEQGGAASAYLGNVVAGNGGGTVTNGINMGGNSCNGAATCP